MYTNIDTFSITDFRHKTSEILRQVASERIVYLIRHSKPEAAVIDLDYLMALNQVYEDHLDTLEFDQTINLPRISLEKHKRSGQKTR